MLVATEFSPGPGLTHKLSLDLLAARPFPLSLRRAVVIKSSERFFQLVASDVPHVCRRSDYGFLGFRLLRHGEGMLWEDETVSTVSSKSLFWWRILLEWEVVKNDHTKGTGKGKLNSRDYKSDLAYMHFPMA